MHGGNIHYGYIFAFCLGREKCHCLQHTIGVFGCYVYHKIAFSVSDAVYKPIPVLQGDVATSISTNHRLVTELVMS